MLLKAGDALNEKEQGGGGRALFLSSVLARTAKTDLYQAEPFLFYPTII